MIDDYGSRHYFCPTCREEYDFGSWTKEAKIEGKNAPLCSKGHPSRMIGVTKKECPICHTTGIPSGYGAGRLTEGDVDPKTGLVVGDWMARDENKPCGKCYAEIANLREFREKQIKANAEKEIWHVEAYPRFWISGSSWVSSQERHALEQELSNMVKAVADPVPEGVTPKGSKFLPTIRPAKVGDQRSAAIGYFKPGVADAIQRVYDLVVDAIEATAVESLEHGKSVLASFAAGDTTLADYDSGKGRR